jgi:GNAT superfamily N-acetyltransferase
MSSVAELGQVPISFTVRRVFDVVATDNTPGQFELLERQVEKPYLKNYDEMNEEGPTEWTRSFDTSNWGFVRAELSGTLVGGAVIACKTPNVTMLEGREDLAVLWDIRVSPELRRQGVGSALFLAVEEWAISRGCRQLKIETQNINVPACNFYARHGCRLGAVTRLAYPELPAEIQLLWYKDLGVSEPG